MPNNAKIMPSNVLCQIFFRKSLDCYFRADVTSVRSINNNNEKKRKGKSSTVYKIFGKFTVSVQDPFTTSEIGPDI